MVCKAMKIRANRFRRITNQLRYLPWLLVAELPTYVRAARPTLYISRLGINGFWAPPRGASLRYS
jgi:hypothetical protein